MEAEALERLIPGWPLGINVFVALARPNNVLPRFRICDQARAFCV